MQDTQIAAKRHSGSHHRVAEGLLGAHARDHSTDANMGISSIESSALVFVDMCSVTHAFITDPADDQNMCISSSVSYAEIYQTKLWHSGGWRSARYSNDIRPSEGCGMLEGVASDEIEAMHLQEDRRWSTGVHQVDRLVDRLSADP